MKKLYILILFSIGAFFGKAQYTLTTSSNPVIGEVENIWNADTTGVSNYASSTGNGQTWLYSTLSVSATASKSQTFVATSAAPNAAAFPGANIAKTDDNVDYEMWNYGTNVVSYGSCNNSVTIVYQNPQQLATLPVTFGYGSTDTYSASYTSGTVSATRNGTISVLGDGTGTLFMPGGKTFNNCLRLKLDIKQVETYPTYTETLTAQQFVYFNSSSKWSLLSVGNFSVAFSFTPSVYKAKSVEVGEALFTGMNEESNAESNFSLYPNPAASSANLWFVLTENENYDMTITNALGQTVRKTSYNDLQPGTYNLEVDLKGLQSGIYYVNLKGRNQEGVKKLIIE